MNLRNWVLSGKAIVNEWISEAVLLTVFLVEGFLVHEVHFGPCRLVVSLGSNQWRCWLAFQSILVVDCALLNEWIPAVSKFSALEPMPNDVDVLWRAVREVFSSPFGVRCLWLKYLSVSLYKVSENQAGIQLWCGSVWLSVIEWAGR